jgi:hypothetical protein
MGHAWQTSITLELREQAAIAISASYFIGDSIP